MVKALFKQPLFVIGASIILLLVIASVVTGMIYRQDYASFILINMVI